MILAALTNQAQGALSFFKGLLDRYLRVGTVWSQLIFGSFHKCYPILYQKLYPWSLKYQNLYCNWDSLLTVNKVLPTLVSTSVKK